MTKKRYWVVSPNATNNKAEEPSWKKAIIENGYVFMGWGESDPLGKKFIKEVSIGDVILVAQGANWNKNMFIAGVVCSDAIKKHIKHTPREAYYRILDFIVNKSELEKLEIDFNDSAYGVASRIPAIYELHPNKNKQDKEVASKLNKIIKEKTKMKDMETIIELIKYKKQIVLQGPPGTGKTYLAKQIAEELTKEKTLGTPMQKIDDFFKNFDPGKEEVKNRKNLSNKLLEQFHKNFPMNNLDELTLEEYAVGTGSNNSFCWWLERGLKPIGYYSPGSARSYLIYWNKEKGQYSKHTNLVKDIEDDEEAMKIVAAKIKDLVITEDYNKYGNVFGDALMLKILHSYHPDKYFPINSKHLLNKALKAFGETSKNLNPIELNKKLLELFNKKKVQHNSKASSLDFSHFLFHDLGIKGETMFEDKEIVSKGMSQLIQFHPAYSYEDFVRGIMVKINEEKTPEYIVENKILADFAQKASDNPNANFVLIIDEINRANLPAVLGELIYALEYRNEPVESIYAVNTPDQKSITIPDNLLIIGTMNTADRSVGHIDYAIRRRFAFKSLYPEKHVISEVIEDSKVRTMAEDLFDEVQKLFTKENITHGFDPKHLQLGHSYFLAKTKEELELKLEYEIKPILQEYINDGILNENLKETVNSLNIEA